MKRNVTNIFELIDSLISKEKQLGVNFDSRGFPVFEKWAFFNTLPAEILPYRHRLASETSNNMAVCFYEPDEALYRRLDKLEETAEELRQYACFVGFDLSIFSDFLRPFQDFYILANLVIDAYFILKGNKMIPNLRADESGGHYFYLFNDAPVVCCGTLGCSKRKDARRTNKELINNYAAKHPNQIVIQYGSKLIERENSIQFQSFGRRRKQCTNVPEM